MHKNNGGYRLLFLSTDHLSGELTEMSEQQLDWLHLELKKPKTKPLQILLVASFLIPHQ